MEYHFIAQSCPLTIVITSMVLYAVKLLVQLYLARRALAGNSTVPV